ncbi:MAG: hypothetical protein IPK19_41515 [Chloroflexi bacterium]|nr:hypothetical protein [Chloroflexota bacterium]
MTDRGKHRTYPCGGRERTQGRLDVLVNGGFTTLRAAEADLAQVREALRSHTRRVVMVQSFLPLLKPSNHGRIANVSSQADRWTASAHARLQSVEALNAFTIMLAADLRRRRMPG